MNPLLITILGIIPLVVVGEDSDVIDFSNKDSVSFKSELSKHDTVLVEFFAPWCGHCKRLAPEFAKAAGALKSHDPPIPLAKVDCTAESGGKDLCNEFGVSGYPTLKIFKGGDFSQEYSGPRDFDGIVNHMKSQVGPASKAYTSFAALNQKLKDAKDVTVIGLFDSESDDLAKIFQKSSDRMRETINFAHVYSTSASDKVSDLVLKGIKLSVPSIILCRPPVLNNKFEPSFVAYGNEDSLEDWINGNYHGLVGHRTQSNMQGFKTPYVIAYYDVDYVKNPKGTNYWRNRILKVAKNFPKLSFAISNSQSFAGELEEYGLEPSKEGRDSAPYIAARDKDAKKFVLKEKFSVEALESFVEDFVAGKLESFVKSEEIPADNTGPVKVAVGKNFDDLVLNTKKDVLIEFYAPWCGHCKKLAPIWEELGAALKDEANVDIVKMDATANDVTGPFVVHGFPTIFWYPADTKDVKKYEGGREVKDFVEYIAKHATKELNGYSRDGKVKAEGKTEL